MEREFENKVAVITGGAKGIGKCICGEFEKQGAKVCVIDLLDNPYFTGDLADKAVLERFAAKVIADYGRVDFLVNNALPLFKGIDQCSYEEFEYAQRVGNPLDIANMVLYLCSDKAGFITGENICIDGGMTRQMIYHNDFGWKLEE